ncbi:hypothetical protein [Liquorilactobacillus vini]|uniref:hypothetical protein n=1 Tax=Liquorilactobacillus vini TaxID=238015 RepID=UPI000556F271|nr:hypothetical protein [Liquorilactobacillus vini]
MAKVQNEMATRISLDAVSAIGTFKDLTNAVKASTNMWKSNVSMLSSVGDQMGAAKAKFEGLGNTISIQSKKFRN